MYLKWWSGFTAFCFSTRNIQPLFRHCSRVAHTPICRGVRFLVVECHDALAAPLLRTESPAFHHREHLPPRTPFFLKMWWLPRTRSSNPSQRSRLRGSRKLMLASDFPCRMRVRSSAYLSTGANLTHLGATAPAYWDHSPKGLECGGKNLSLREADTQMQASAPPPFAAT